MVSSRDTKNAVHVKTMSDGKVCYDLFAANNKEAVVLTTAGIWRDDVLLPGKMVAMHDNPSTTDLIRAFHAAMRRENFKKVGDFWVGPYAMDWLENGKRLAAGGAAPSPLPMDLKMPEARG